MSALDELDAVDSKITEMMAHWRVISDTLQAAQRETRDIRDRLDRKDRPGKGVAKETMTADKLAAITGSSGGATHLAGGNASGGATGATVAATASGLRPRPGDTAP